MLIYYPYHKQPYLVLSYISNCTYLCYSSSFTSSFTLTNALPSELLNFQCASLMSVLRSLLKNYSYSIPFLQLEIKRYFAEICTWTINIACPLTYSILDTITQCCYSTLLLDTVFLLGAQWVVNLCISRIDCPKNFARSAVCKIKVKTAIFYLSLRLSYPLQP